MQSVVAIPATRAPDHYPPLPALQDGDGVIVSLAAWHHGYGGPGVDGVVEGKAFMRMYRSKVRPGHWDINLPWVRNGDRFHLELPSISAAVCPVYMAGLSNGWKTIVTVTGKSGGYLTAEYGGCLPETGIVIVEAVIAEQSIGIPHFQKELRDNSVKRPSKQKKAKK